MKKFLIILLMSVYGLSSSGMTVNLHYCCGKLDGVTFPGQHDSGCEMASVKKNNKCCHNQQVTVKLNTDQQQAAKWMQSNKGITSLPPAPVGHFSFVGQLSSACRLARGTPVPIQPPIPLYLRNCSFRV